MMLLAKFGKNSSISSGEEVENRKRFWTDRQTAKQTPDEECSEKFTLAFSSGELKMT